MNNVLRLAMVIGVLCASSLLVWLSLSQQMAHTTLDGASLGTLRRTLPPDLEPCRGPCGDRAGTAVAVLNAEHPGHPAIAWIGEFEHGRPNLCPDGRLCRYSGSGPPTIFVFKFVDGTALPIEIGCPGVGPCRVFGFDGRLR